MGIFKTLKELCYFLEYSEITNPNFWFFTCLFAIILNFFPLDPVYFIQSPTTKTCIEKTVAGQTVLIICGGDSESRLARVLGKRKKFDLAFYRRLEQHFPDWEERMNYQKKQEEFYKSAMRKESELKRLRIKDTSKFYTKQELDAIDYFHGTGFYKKYQDPAIKPNIFDTRQTFLFKMHDRMRLLEFLNSFNGRTN